MKKSICIYFLILNFLIAKSDNNPSYVSSSKAHMELIENTFYSFEGLKSLYEEKGFKLVYDRNHRYKEANNRFFIFERIATKTNVKRDRILVIAKRTKGKSYEILFEKIDFIYDSLSVIQCDGHDGFSKIETDNYSVTFEQFICGKENSIIEENLTFRFDARSKEYLLNGYSVTVRQKLGPDDDNHYVFDEYPSETIGEDKVGVISLDNLNTENLNQIRKKLPNHIFALFY